jgi:hypothetical protein
MNKKNAFTAVVQYYEKMGSVMVTNATFAFRVVGIFREVIS